MSFEKGRYLGGIIDRQSLKYRCIVDDETGCWHWKQSLAEDGVPRVCVRMEGGDYKLMRGRSAAVYIGTGAMPSKDMRPIPTKDCPSDDCVNPEHSVRVSMKTWRKWVSSSGRLKNSPKRILANRKNGKSRSRVSPEIAEAIRTSSEKGVQLAIQYGISDSIVSAIRRGIRHRVDVIRSASVFSYRP